MMSIASFDLNKLPEDENGSSSCPGNLELMCATFSHRGFIYCVHRYVLMINPNKLAHDESKPPPFVCLKGGKSIRRFMSVGKAKGKQIR